ncbi:methyltransferase domain-containing protein [Glaciecola sp. XM2]|uniref:methyltransferase domain-containing protein n=1 Tax=Glaciecola sp. XM2 TaxID=1914931 RepID=UPI001BDF181F|nr:methyltransferase domain-containing protein [Glaciecola sp. XM2]MBT1451976.1 methyltransferase domain-containing protein [Glaciecola sp. XM2]
MKSGSFDGIANKFDRNIYGTTKGQMRHQLLCFYLSDLLNGAPMTVLDAGAGTGMMAQAFAQQGHHLHLVDVSEEALSIARERLNGHPHTQFTLGGIDSISGKYDLVVCHAVLEWLEHPLQALDALLAHVKVDGQMSVSFFNQQAMLFNNAIYGNFDYIEKGMKVRNVVRLNPHNPQSPASVLEHLAKRDDISIELSAGIRCFHDYMRDPSMQSNRFDELLALEKQYGAQTPYKWLGKYFYIRVRKLN